MSCGGKAYSTLKNGGESITRESRSSQYNHQKSHGLLKVENEVANSHEYSASTM